jgi:hypothetical protein
MDGLATLGAPWVLSSDRPTFLSQKIVFSNSRLWDEILAEFAAM